MDLMAICGSAWLQTPLFCIGEHTAVSILQLEPLDWTTWWDLQPHELKSKEISGVEMLCYTTSSSLCTIAR